MTRPPLCAATVMILALLPAMPLVAQDTNPGAHPSASAGTASTMNALLKQPWGTFFWCARTGGAVHLGDAESHFNHNQTLDKLTYDISNNCMLANHGANGELKALTCYRDTYITLTTSWPGVWTAKDNSTFGPYSFSLEMDGTTVDLAQVDWDLRTGLLDNTIPITQLTAPGKRFTVRIVTFAPISADGAQRLRGVVYGLEIENTSSAPFKATVIVPTLPCGKKPYDQWAQSDSFGSFDISLGDATSFNGRIAVDLAPGASAWVPVILSAPGEGVAEAVNARGTVAWLVDTQAYYRRLLGHLSTPGQPYLGAFYERMLLQAFQSIGQSGSGRIAGSNWGSVPTTRMIWTKDFFYSSLPLMAADPAFAEKLVDWFNRYGVRPLSTLDRASEQPKPGASAGGVGHSISLSVAGPLLGGLLYDRTGDRALFQRHPEWKAHWATILDAIIATRPDRNVWLFPTRYISDGPVRGDFHTGSNVCVWRALRSYARLLEEVWKDPAGARIFSAAADHVKEALLTREVITGALGRQFIEAALRDGSAPKMESDGEESDTTLMPFYGFLPNDDARYANFMRFSASPANAAFRPALHAISWEGSVPSTAPGYNKGVCASTDTAGLFGADGTFTQMRHLADGDGSLWWWSYGQDKDPHFGSPTRAYMDIGKSGWCSGVFSCVFTSRLTGITYDAPTTTLDLAPLAAIGDFTWTDLPMGNDRFTVGCTYHDRVVTMIVTNDNDHPTHVVAHVPCPQGEGMPEVHVNGAATSAVTMSTYCGRKTATVHAVVTPKGTLDITVSGK